jgi:hypothetical protein
MAGYTPLLEIKFAINEDNYDTNRNALRAIHGRFSPTPARSQKSPQT